LEVDEFYDDTLPEIWKKVIGNDLHYHVGWGEGDILYNAVKHLYQFIDKKSSVLDCGCGWGGTGKVLKRDMGCEVTGVTISQVQSDYISDNNLFPVVLSDLHDYTTDNIYDVCLFVESFCHLKSPQKVLSNISNVTDKIILREYHMKSNEHPKKYVDNWLMNIYHIDEICSFFGELDFKLTYQEEHYDYSLEPTVEFWLQNLDKLDSIEKTKHIQLLELSARYLKQNKDQILRDIGLATLVFER
tara:strand:- start:98 stop:829 length:732 start_codon:yes stop_codon:yes gene_type:complete